MSTRIMSLAIYMQLIFFTHPLYFQVNLSPFIPIPLRIDEGKGDLLKRGASPLLNTSPNIAPPFCKGRPGGIS